MTESIYTKNALKQFKSTFSNDWIEKYKWEKEEKGQDNFRDGISKILTFKELVFLNYSKLVLSADFFRRSIKDLDNLLSLSMTDIAPDDTFKYKSLLQKSYQELLDYLSIAIKLTKFHCESAKKHFENLGDDEDIPNFLMFKKYDKEDDLIQLLDEVIDVCTAEYNFTYKEKYVHNLLIHRETLLEIKNSFSPNVQSIISATCKKAELLLIKLSFFANHNIISYNFNFKRNNFNYDMFQDNKAKTNIIDIFKKFNDVSEFKESEIELWQRDSFSDNVNMWSFVLLMRYYVKKTKSLEQIDKLITLFEIHYKQNIVLDKNAVNLYAIKSAKNYMYNSRFSFLCQNVIVDTETLRDEITKIRYIQSETFIKSYYPFQKAVEWLINKLNILLHGNADAESIRMTYKLLVECMDSLKLNIKWCKRHQPYLIQMRYNYCMYLSPEFGFKVFLPSSFCRPLNFPVVDEKIVQYQNEVANIKYQVDNYDKVQRLFEAQNAIKNMKKDNVELLGAFTTVVTFLVGLISVFTGNSKDISLFTRIEYVVVLGACLIIFDCIGYFALSNCSRKCKAWILGFVLIALIVTGCLSYLHHISLL